MKYISATLLLFLSQARADMASAPWEELSSSTSATIADASPQLYLQQCWPDLSITNEIVSALIQGQQPSEERIVEYNSNMTSGVCLMKSFTCGFKNCNPLAASGTLHEQFATFVPESNPNYWSDLSDIATPENPSFDIPSKTIFPRTPGDIVAIVQFAKKYTLELSVKNSGHSYQGASQKEGTLLLNMIQFKEYSPTGIVECTSEEADAAGPCKLALARSKKGYVRVGGGENFQTAYSSVKAFNEGLGGGYKYMLVGGAYPTVSPMGWTFQGGLAGSTAGRLFGFGVDQVLMVDMVIPAGVHVRFGPTEWDSSFPTVYPRNYKIEGQCQENPQEANEDLWVWSDCPSDLNVNFGDLWFALLGGGGGTFGIVTALYLQLHDWVPIQRFAFHLKQLNETCGIPITFPPQATDSYDIFDSSGYDVNFEVFGRTYWGFTLDFFHDPLSIGVNESESHACTCDMHATFGTWGVCYGEGAVDAYVAAWKRYVIANNQTMVDAGVTYSDIQKAFDCIDKDGMIDPPNTDAITELGGGTIAYLHGTYGPAYQVIKDGPLHNTQTNVLVPKKWALDNKEAAISILLSMNADSYFAFGGATDVAQDKGWIGLSDAHRTAAFMTSFHYALPDNFYSSIFPQMYDTTTDNFPGFIGSNHIAAFMRGPLKSDWTQPCPMDWTDEERNEKCISAQESIYGSERLARLESIKEAVDPDYMLDCNGCVGNNRASSDKASDSSAFHLSSGLVTNLVLLCLGALIDL